MAISDDILVIDQASSFKPEWPALFSPAAIMDFMTAPASLSRHLNSGAPPPRLFHSIYQQNSSILCLSATESYIFGGRQSGDILVRNIRCLAVDSNEALVTQVWDRHLYSKKTALKGHEGSVLAMEYAVTKGWLFSSSGTVLDHVPSKNTISLSSPLADSTVRVGLLHPALSRCLISTAGLGHSRSVSSLRPRPVPSNRCW